MTGADFISTCLENLGVLAAGQAASAEDVAIVHRRMTPKFAQLAEEDITVVPDETEIDDAQALLLADVIAMECANAFGITGQKLLELAAAAEDGRHRLQVVTRERATGTTLALGRWWGGGRRGYYNGPG